MYRVLAVIETMSQTLHEATTYLSDAVHAIEAEMSALEGRLADDAHALEQALQKATLNENDRATLTQALKRVEATANAVAHFAHRNQEAPPPRPN